MQGWRPLQATRLEQKGFRGMRDVIDSTPETADMPMIVHNMASLDPVNGGPLVTRPPWSKIGTAPSGACALLYSYERLDGTTDILGVFNAQVYKYNGSTWSVYLSVATLSVAGITIAGNCFAVTLNGKLIVTDGVSNPWMYDGPNTTLTNLTNCPVLYGRPAVYYAKLFGIKSTERSTIVWSEENDATIGYEAGGFNNAWTLGQTGAQPLQAILATNDALFYWRKHSMGQIRGAVTTDFVNDGTHDGISQTVGTSNPAPLIVDRTIYWADSYGRPHYLTIGGDIQALYPQMQRKFDQQAITRYIYSTTGHTYGDGWELSLYSDYTSIDDTIKIRTVYDPVLRLVLFAFVASNGFNDATGLDDVSNAIASSHRLCYFACFSHDTKVLQSYWSFPRGNSDGASFIGNLKNPYIGDEGVVIHVPGIGVSAVGLVLFGDHSATYALDDEIISGGKSCIPQFIVGPQQGLSDDFTVAFARLDVSVGARPKTTSVGDGRTYEGQIGTALQTSNRQVSSELSAPIFSGDAGLYPAGGTGQVQTAGTMRQTQNSFGFDEEGRWARALIRLIGSTSGTPYASAYPLAVYGWTLTAMARSRVPATNIAPP